MRLADQLSIQTDNEVIIDGRICVTKVLKSGIRLVHNWNKGKVVKYCVSNIAQLLMLKPFFSKEETQRKIITIKEKDSMYAIATIKENSIIMARKGIYELVQKWNKLVWEGGPYQLYNWRICYSFGTDISKDWTTTIIRPSANFITDDVLWFKPIDMHFSRDSKYIYYTYHKIDTIEWEIFQN